MVAGCKDAEATHGGESRWAGGSLRSASFRGNDLVSLSPPPLEGGHFLVLIKGFFWRPLSVTKRGAGSGERGAGAGFGLGALQGLGG